MKEEAEINRRLTEVSTRLASVQAELDRINKILPALSEQLYDCLDDFADILSILEPSPTSSATRLTLTVRGGQMSQFTVDTTDGVANLQFTDDHGDSVVGPNDSVTGQPVVPVVSSDTPTVLTVAAATSDPSTPGGWAAALTMVAEGTATLSVEPLTNSDGTPVLDGAGNPFGVPAPVVVTVAAGEATSLTLTVTG